MKVRIATIGVPRFQHDGLNVTEAWSELELDDMTPETRAALVAHSGRLLRVHPDDVGHLAGSGLEALETGQLKDLKAAAEEAGRQQAAAQPAQPQGQPAQPAQGAPANPPQGRHPSDHERAHEDRAQAEARATLPADSSGEQHVENGRKSRKEPPHR